MRLKYGTFPFDANSVKLAFSQETLINAGGQPYEIAKRVSADGYLNGDGQAAIQQAVSAMMTAIARPYQDLVFYRDDGTASDLALLNAGSTTGVIITDLKFPDSIGGEYATFRRFTFEARASYPVPNSGALLVSFRERLSFSGGGPIRRHKLAINGLHQRQEIYPSSIYKVTQEGEAVGFLARPSPPGPLWPDDLMESPDTTMESPERRGSRYTDFAVTWRYNFESINPLIGVPNIWKG